MNAKYPGILNNCTLVVIMCELKISQALLKEKEFGNINNSILFVT